MGAGAGMGAVPTLSGLHSLHSPHSGSSGDVSGVGSGLGATTAATSTSSTSTVPLPPLFTLTFDVAPPDRDFDASLSLNMEELEVKFS